MESTLFGDKNKAISPSKLGNAILHTKISNTTLVVYATRAGVTREFMIMKFSESIKIKRKKSNHGFLCRPEYDADFTQKL